MAEGQKKILVVDDEVGLVSLLSILLKSQGYSVITAGNGHKALELARTEQPDLILLDVMLPKMDGFHVARMLKFDENFRHIPIVMLTARVQGKDIATGHEVGVEDYIVKPFDAEKLFEKIRDLLSGKLKNG